MFEKITFLKSDTGGWRGNFALADLPGRRTSTSCGTESRTFRYFIDELIALNLVEEFSPEGYAFRYSHAATLLKSKNHTSIVLDSWHEDGGMPANINFYDDWLNEQDHLNIVDVIL